MDVYDIFFSICLGLFIGGLILSIVSFILAETSVHDQTADHIDHVDQIDHVDHVDHVDHPDYFDHVDHVDHIDHVDHPDYFDHVDHVDHIDHVDHPDYFDHVDHVHHIDHVEHPDYFDHVDHVDHPDHVDHEKQFQTDSQIQEGSTPAPFMLLLSSALLVFGISGIASYYVIGDLLKFLMFIIAPATSILITKLISTVWKKIAISKHYSIASTENLIGTEGEVILKVDDYGGVIRISSNNPLKVEKLHVMPHEMGEVFEKEEKVVIVGVKNDHLLVDKKSTLTKKKY